MQPATVYLLPAALAAQNLNERDGVELGWRAIRQRHPRIASLTADVELHRSSCLPVTYVVLAETHLPPESVVREDELSIPSYAVFFIYDCAHTQIQGKGFAFVQFVIPEDAGKALEQLDRHAFHGRLLHIMPARRQPGSSGAEMAGRWVCVTRL